MASHEEESVALTSPKVANARVAGMEEDLRLDVGSRYTTALLVFFIAHIFFGVSLHQSYIHSGNRITDI